MLKDTGFIKNGAKTVLAGAIPSGALVLFILQTAQTKSEASAVHLLMDNRVGAIEEKVETMRVEWREDQKEILKEIKELRRVVQNKGEK